MPYSSLKLQVHGAIIIKMMLDSAGPRVSSTHNSSSRAYRNDAVHLFTISRQCSDNKVILNRINNSVLIKKSHTSWGERNIEEKRSERPSPLLRYKL